METITPENDAQWHALRAQNINSTDIAALYGVSPYKTKLEVWHNKKNRVTQQIEINERMKWGTRLQDTIAAGVAEDQGWKIRRMNEYIHDPALRIGASFDFHVDPNELLEVKNVDGFQYKEGWIVDGDTIEAPPHIELQVQHQLLVSERETAWLCAFVGGNRPILVRKNRDESVIRSIRQQVAAFWESIDSGRAPEPDFPRDADFICSLYANARPGSVVQASPEVCALVTEYQTLGAKEKELGELRDGLKAKILMAIGDAEKVLGDSFSISAKVTPAKQVEAYERAAYRSFRVTSKKGNK